MEAYSVLMSVYVKENPEHFATAIESILDQTVITNDFVIVCDGPLTQQLDDILNHYAKQYPDIFNIVRLEKNVGIGAAANVGLQHCKNDLVAKMDGDDIAVPNRCETQLRLFKEDPDLTVCGGYIEEFDENPDEPYAIRAVPLSNEEIRYFAKRRQPFNNMTVMYRRNAVFSVGGYHDLRRCEDYDLYIRLLHAGYKAANTSDVLVYARVNRDAYTRRGSWVTLKGCILSRWRAYKLGYSSLLDVAICVAGECIIIISPKWLKQFIYRRFLRKSM